MSIKQSEMRMHRVDKLEFVKLYMKILVECGLVNDRKEGKWHHYSLNCETLLDFKDFIGSLTCVL